MSENERLLIELEGLPADYLQVVERFWSPLADNLARRMIEGRPLLVGVNGAQGSGKSTMCRFLVSLLAERSLHSVALSLDDFYLTREQRQRRANEIHPLFATRGVPGTHDTALMRQVLDALMAGRRVEAPRFDKAADDRSAAPRRIEPPVDLILFEGWCVGAAAQSEEALREPVNALERDEDPDAIWRREVNRRLQSDYSGIFNRLDMLIMLQVAGFESVAANRRLQEEKLARANPGGEAIMDEAALQRFIMHYERLTRHMLAELPERADVVIPIGQDQRPTSLPAAIGREK